MALNAISNFNEFIEYKEEIEKAWEELSADDPEGCPEGEENEDDPADQNNTEDDIPTIHVNSDDSDKE